MLEYLRAIWNTLRPFGIFYSHFGNLVVIGIFFLDFGILYQGKSGNPAPVPMPLTRRIKAFRYFSSIEMSTLNGSATQTQSAKKTGIERA
jgi:hypothetical protein